MHETTQTLQSQIDNLKEKYFKKLNKNNIRVRFLEEKIRIKSSIWRLTPAVQLVMLSGSIYTIVQPNTEPYWVMCYLFIAFFTYSLWEDTKSINNLEIYYVEKTLHISYLNSFRFLLLKILFRYKRNYSMHEIKAFEFREKYNPNIFWERNYVEMCLVNDARITLLDLPDREQATVLVDFLNDLKKLK